MIILIDLSHGRSSTVSKLVLFDSGLNQLRLPILPSLSFGDTGENEPRRGTLSVLLDRYFEWKAEFPDGERWGLDKVVVVVVPTQTVSVDPKNDQGDAQDNDSTVQDVSETKSMRLSRLLDTKAEDGEEAVTWTWAESVHVDEDGRAGTIFLWDDNMHE